MSLDALKAEITIKRKSIDPLTNGRPNKYMRRGELDKLKEEQERKEREEKQRKKAEELAKKEAAWNRKGKVSCRHLLCVIQLADG